MCDCFQLCVQQGEYSKVTDQMLMMTGSKRHAHSGAVVQYQNTTAKFSQENSVPSVAYSHHATDAKLNDDVTQTDNSQDGLTSSLFFFEGI